VNATDSVLPKIDYGIITIKEEEFSAVKSRFAPMELIHGRDRSYFRGVIQTHTGKSRTIAIVRCPNQGQGEAQAVASDLIADLKPRWILVVGIAGAVPAEEFGLGDVLLASRVLDFSVQAAIEDHPPELDASGSWVHPMVARLLSFIHETADELGPWDTPEKLGTLRPTLTIPKELKDDRYYGDHSWRVRVQNALRTRFRGKRGTHKPRLRIGEAATSNTLVKDTKLVTQWKSAARSITHMEMELGGVYRAASKSTRSVPVLSVRGISDIVGFRRDAKWTDYACTTAASFVDALVTSDLPFFDNRSARPLAAIVDLSKTPAGDLPEDTRALEITLEIEVGDSLPHLEEQILGSISPVARMNEMMVLRRPRVPVTITIAVTEAQIRRLLAAASSGELAAAGIKSIVPTDVRDGLVVPPHEA
jgi:nucleoside phosphorylase